LVEGAAFAVDASLIAADANKQRSAAGSDDVDWEAIARTRRSVREHLDTLDEAARGAASETVAKSSPSRIRLLLRKCPAGWADLFQP
jgi:hypothetical protein